MRQSGSRATYPAGFQAAQALIPDRTGRAVKTHGGLRTEFHRIVRGAPRSDGTLRDLLGSTYTLKAVADFETGPGSDVSPERAAQAIEEAKQFVSGGTEMLAAT